MANSRLASVFKFSGKTLALLLPIAIAYFAYRYTIERDEPLIHVIGPPKLVAVWWASTPMSLKSNPKIPSDKEPWKNPVRIQIHPESLVTQISLTNRGNRLAKVFAYVYYDTVSFEPVLRKRLANLDVTDTGWVAQRMPKIYEIPPNETVPIKIVQPLWNLSGLDMVLHYLILYEGQVDRLYNTYYWASYRLAPEFRERVQDYFAFVQDQQSYETYTSQRSAVIKQVSIRKYKLQEKLPN